MINLKTESISVFEPNVYTLWFDGTSLKINEHDVGSNIYSPKITIVNRPNDHFISIIFTSTYDDNLIGNDSQTNNEIEFIIDTSVLGKQFYIFNSVENKTINIILNNKNTISYKHQLDYTETLYLISSNDKWILHNQYYKIKEYNKYIFASKFNFMMLLNHIGKGWSWGYNGNGELGINSGTHMMLPAAICGDITFCQLALGEAHSIGIDYLGKAWAWGDNTNGRLGDNTITGRPTPTAVCGDITFCQINIGLYHSIGIDHQGKAWTWGLNNYGQLGDNTIVSKRTPVAVCGDITFCQISAGSYYSIGIDHQGKAWAWGNNAYGMLGDNTSNISKRTPVAVCGDITFCQIAGGSNHCISIDYQGKAWAWGYNNNGQLGINASTSKTTPVEVCGDITFCQMTAGSLHTIGIDHQGKGWAWGDNAFGQLGDNSITIRLTPVAVCADITFCQISAGNQFSAGIDHQGKAWTWGLNTWGQLGDNTTTSRRVPGELYNFYPNL